jgi:phosphoglycerate dehydrogenase-like enzyme
LVSPKFNDLSATGMAKPVGPVNLQALMPRALISTNVESFRLVFSPDVRRSLANRVEGADRFYTPAELREDPDLLAEVEFLFTSWRGPKLDEAFLIAAPRLRAVFHAAGSVRQMVTPAFWSRGIPITSAQEANGLPVGDFAYAQVALSLKGYWRLAREYRGLGSIPRGHKEGTGLHQAVVGIISLGSSARRLLKRLACHQLEILAYDPYVTPEMARRLGVTLTSLEDIFDRSHVVSCHAPLNEATEGIVTADLLSRLQPRATFINTARGRVVDNPALFVLLQQRPDLTALLDVTDPEPLPADSPAWSLPNLIVSPHIAGSIGNECSQLGEAMVDEFDRFLAGQPMLGAIDELAAAMAT